MAFTNRFGLTHFGAGVSGSLSADGQKYTGRDRRTIDRILAALEQHTHDGGERLANPDFAPTLTLSPTGGALRSGRTYHYVVTYLDRYGLETAPSTEVSVTTEAALAPPPSPAVEAEAGGDLEPGLYWYGFTVFKDGNETAMSPASAITITNWNTVRIQAPNGLPAGTDGVSVWRQGPLDGGFTRLVTEVVADPETPPDPIFLDDGSIVSTCGPGCIPGPESLPPTENLTNATSSVEIEIPAIDTTLGIIAWRVYRTTQSGVYLNSLIAEVVETASELEGDLVNVFVDEGSAAMPGSPPVVSQTLTPGVEIVATGGGEGGGTALPSSSLIASVETAALEDLLATTHQAAIQGNFYYAIDATTDGLVVVDVSLPHAPRVVATLALTITAAVAGLAVSGDHLYVIDNTDPTTVRVVNISDPLAPIQVGTPFTLPLNTAAGYGDAYKAVVEFPLLFVSGVETLYVVNVSDPLTLTLVEQYELPVDNYFYPEFDQASVIRSGDAIRLAFTHDTLVNDGGRHGIYIAESVYPFEVVTVSVVTPAVDWAWSLGAFWIDDRFIAGLEYASATSDANLYVYDTEDEAFKGTLNLPVIASGYAVPNHYDAAGGFAYVSSAEASHGVRALDLRDPDNPRLVWEVAPDPALVFWGGAPRLVIQGDFLYYLAQMVASPASVDLLVFGAAPPLDLAGSVVAINTQVTSYTLALSDQYVRMNDASPLNVTVPEEAVVASPVGRVVSVRQVGAGTVTLVEDTGVTIVVPDGFTFDLAGPGSEVSLIYLGSDVWEGGGGFAEAV